MNWIRLNLASQDVAAAQQADEEVVHQVFLPYNHLAHFQGKEVYKGTLFLNAFVQFTDVYAFHIIIFNILPIFPAFGREPFPSPREGKRDLGGVTWGSHLHMQM